MQNVRHLPFTRAHFKWLRDMKVRCERTELDIKENPGGLGYDDKF